ncbi:MAG: SIMPL domain-containing protein [Methanoregula sp.]|uniref:SIMPL domain-containing protein n=1 Tax=Methanoregula sp. TaxID=2052170 RepID=UPI003C46E189
MRKMIVLTLALVLAMALIGCASAVDSTNDHVIQVSGTGSVTGTPDRVHISFAVETDNPDVKIAQANNAVAMNNVVDALAASGIPPGQMKTTDYSITPVYQTDNNGVFSNTIKTYQVTNALQVTLRDTNTTGQVIDTAVAAGANQVNSIQFMLSNEQAQALRSQALSKAIANARADADTAAAALNVTITGTQTADISQGYTPVLYGTYDTLAASSKAAAAPTPIQSGDITVTAQVSVTYLIG